MTYPGCKLHKTKEIKRKIVEAICLQWHEQLMMIYMTILCSAMPKKYRGSSVQKFSYSCSNVQKVCDINKNKKLIQLSSMRTSIFMGLVFEFLIYNWNAIKIEFRMCIYEIFQCK